MAGAADLIIEQGADYSAAYSWLEDGVPQDFSAWTVRSEFRKKPGGDELFLNLAPYFAADTDDDDKPILRLYIPGEVTRTLTRSGVWDLFLTDGSGVDRRLLAGKVEVVKAVTKDD